MIAAVLAAASLLGTSVGGAMPAPAPVLGPPTPPAPVPVATVTPAPTASPTDTPTATPTPTATAVATLPPQSTKSTSVGATEYAFTLTQTTVDAGAVKVQFDLSRAADPHQLVIAGDDGVAYDSGKQHPGSVTKATVTLSPGVYQLVCPLPQHEALGMHARLTVSARPGA